MFITSIADNDIMYNCISSCIYLLLISAMPFKREKYSYST